MTPLHVTPIARARTLGLLVEKGANPYNINSRNGDSILHHAIRSKCLDSVECLLEAQCDPNCKNRDGLTPLHIAVEVESTDIVKELLHHGADSNVAYPHDGGTVLHHACRFNFLPIFQYLLKTVKCNPNEKNDAGESPLHIATVWKDGSFELVKELIEGGADPNVQDNDGNTLLHYACKNVGLKISMSCFNYLLDCKMCDPNIKNRDGSTPIHLINQGPKRLSVIDEMISKRANIHQPDGNSDTLLHKACKAGESETVIHLLGLKCDPNSMNKAGQTPLQVIPLSHPSAISIIDEIIKSGGDLDFAIDENGNSLLHKACSIQD